MYLFPENVFVCSASCSTVLANSKWVYFLPELTKGIDSNSQTISFEVVSAWRCLYNSPPPLYPHLWIHVQLHHFWEYYHCEKTGMCLFSGWLWDVCHPCTNRITQILQLVGASWCRPFICCCISRKENTIRPCWEKKGFCNIVYNSYGDVWTFLCPCILFHSG